jgi:streptogramin lyase
MKGTVFASVLAAATALASLPALAQTVRPEPQRVAQPASLPGLGAPVDFELRVASQPLALIQASDGTIWFAAYTLGALGRIDRASREITYFPLGTGARPYGLVEAPDKSILAVDRALNVLHRLAPANGEVTRIGMPADLPFLDLASLRLDTEGRIWFSGASGWLGSHDPRTGTTDVSSHEDLQGLVLSAASPTGSLWGCRKAYNVACWNSWCCMHQCFGREMMGLVKNREAKRCHKVFGGPSVNQCLNTCNCNIVWCLWA